MNPILSGLVVWAMLGQQQKAPGVEQVLKPELTLLEKEEARVKGIDTWIIGEAGMRPPHDLKVAHSRPTALRRRNRGEFATHPYQSALQA